MKKTLLLLTWSVFLLARAGGIMTNTNYHIAWDRMMARGATFQIDGAFSNPAGLVWGHKGWQFSFNWQMPSQNRDIEATCPLFMTDPNATHQFKGKASAPFVPALFAAYNNEKWAVSAMIGIVGSGGYVRYDDGVPMFTVPLTGMLLQGGMAPGTYDLDASMKGKQYIYGGQVNFSYLVTKNLSAAVGLRANYYSGYYRGHVTANMSGLPSPHVHLALDADQTDWGFNPILSANYRIGKLTLSGRYEFRTKIETKNKTKELTAEIMGKTPHETAALLGDKVAAYQDGARTRYDLPALLSLAVGYEFTPRLRATAEYHFFDDKHAKMAGDKQKTLTHGTSEFLLGAEYDINDRFTVSIGGQRTDYGLSDDYQTNTSFACDSYSLGLGGAVNITDKLRLNLSYFWTMYSDYTKNSDNYYGTGMAGKEVYSRTNNVFGVGIDYKF